MLLLAKLDSGIGPVILRVTRIITLSDLPFLPWQLRYPSSDNVNYSEKYYSFLGGWVKEEVIPGYYFDDGQWRRSYTVSPFGGDFFITLSFFGPSVGLYGGAGKFGGASLFKASLSTGFNVNEYGTEKFMELILE